MKQLLIIITIFYSLNGFAQQRLLNQIDNRIVIEKFDSFTVQARVKHYDIKPKKNRLYYWYWKNSFQKNYGGIEGSLLDGDYIVFDKQENLLEKATFKKGIIRGKYLYWNKEGVLIKEERWKCGVKSGIYKIYNDESVLVEKGRFCKAKKNGLVRNYIDTKVYKIQKFKKGKMVKDLSKEKRERQDEAMDKKKERMANKKTKELEETKNPKLKKEPKQEKEKNKQAVKSKKETVTKNKSQNKKSKKK